MGLRAGEVFLRERHARQVLVLHLRALSLIACERLDSSVILSARSNCACASAAFPDSASRSAFQLQVASHRRHVLGLLSQRVLFVDQGEASSILPLSTATTVSANSAVRRSPSVRAFVGKLLELGRRFRRLALIHQGRRDAGVRVHEVLIDGQRLLILRDRLVELAHLQEQLRIGVVGVRIVRDQLDVLLERLLGVGVVAILSIGVAENVEHRRVARVQLGRLLVVLDRLREILLTEVVPAEIEVGALVVRVRRDELLEIVLLLLRVVVGARLGRENQQPLAVRRLARQAHGLGEVVEEFLRRRGDIGPAQLRKREFRIERDGLVEVLDRVSGQQSLGKIATGEVTPCEPLRTRS